MAQLGIVLNVEGEEWRSRRGSQFVDWAIALRIESAPIESGYGGVFSPEPELSV